MDEILKAVIKLKKLVKIFKDISTKLYAEWEGF